MRAELSAPPAGISLASHEADAVEGCKGADIAIEGKDFAVRLDQDVPNRSETFAALLLLAAVPGGRAISGG